MVTVSEFPLFLCPYLLNPLRVRAILTFRRLIIMAPLIIIHMKQQTFGLREVIYIMDFIFGHLSI